MKCKNCGHKIEKLEVKIINTGEIKEEWFHISKKGKRPKTRCWVMDCGCEKPEPTQSPNTSTIPGGSE